ncbi:hypothetical protein AB0F25_25565 [Streptomyces wedmorensis]|uniref:hypothetical protein n=1 Tax=Streptomyces wedmorensis TaxID=43759 RepID=UPI00343BD692
MDQRRPRPGGPADRALRTGVRTGLAVGLYFGALQLTQHGPGVEVPVTVVFFLLCAGLPAGLLFGALPAERRWRSWPGSRALNRADRAAVERATERGEDIGGARLAPAVLDYCGVLREAARGRVRVHRVALRVVPVLTLAIALAATLADEPPAPMWSEAGWKLVQWMPLVYAFWVLAGFPGRQKRALAALSRAEAMARWWIAP